MRNRNFLLLIPAILFLVSAGCKKTRESRVPQMDFEAFEPILKQANDTVYVINFWATWCKPCIEELPEFERIRLEYKGQPVRVVLASLDFPNKHEALLLPFIEENNVATEVIHLIEVNANKWIDNVSPDWSGAIPATLIYRGDRRFFREGKMSYDEIKSEIELKLKTS